MSSSNQPNSPSNPDKLWIVGGIICLFFGLGLSGAGRAAINHPDTASSTSQVLAVPYQLLLHYGGEQLVNGEVGDELRMKVLFIDAVAFGIAAFLVVLAFMWFCSLFSSDNRGGSGGHGGKKNEV